MNSRISGNLIVRLLLIVAPLSSFAAHAAAHRPIELMAGTESTREFNRCLTAMRIAMGRRTGGTGPAVHRAAKRLG